ncbi:MAG: UDP-N-acetylglucosamine 2-epimerase [Chloroflexi bacterium]|nr:UDP-N-acetylglucosamine 2-epimerase [Chloroflexota bacterium]
MTRTIAVLTTGRQDWGILHTTCRAIRAGDTLSLRLMAGGMHLSSRYGTTIEHIRADGFEPDDLLPWLTDDGGRDPNATEQAAAALAAVGRAFERSAPDALVLVGDRFETAAAAIAATVMRVPIVHLHGGEQTGGAFDDPLRHAITKLAHLHLVSNDEHARRVIALGEDPASVHVVGAPGSDAAFRSDLPERDELEADLGLGLEPPVVIVTVQPATLETDPAAVVEPIVAAMATLPASYVITLPNADPGSATVRAALAAAAAADPERRVAVEALGERRYWGLMRIADAMLGNSSSALVEAPVVGLPAVDVGDRQLGRSRLANVSHAPADTAAIAAALREALSAAGRERARAARPALADGRAGERVAHIIAGWQPPVPPRKSPIEVSA